MNLLKILVTGSLDMIKDPIIDIVIGQSESYSQTITDADIKSFSGISGDKNPVHMDSEYAEKSRYGRRIAHGMMSVSYFSALFGMKLPGPGCVYIEQSVKFIRPVYIGDTLTATVEVERVNFEKRRIYFKTYCTVSGKKVITGNAEIYLPKISMED